MLELSSQGCEQIYHAMRQAPVRSFSGPAGRTDRDAIFIRAATETATGFGSGRFAGPCPAEAPGSHPWLARSIPFIYLPAAFPSSTQGLLVAN